jgi:hypothetical protein
MKGKRFLILRLSFNLKLVRHPRRARRARRAARSLPATDVEE